MTRSQSSTAVVLKVFSTLCVAGNVACVKIAADQLPVGEVVAFRGLFALPILMIYGALTTGLASVVRVSRVWRHVWRAVLGCSGLGCYFWSITLLPLPVAVAVSYVTPICIALTGFFQLGRLAASKLVVAAIVGLAGVCVLSVSVGGAVDSVRIGGAFVGVAGALLTAAAILQVRRLTKTDSASAIAFYFSVACFVFGSLSIPFGWVLPSPFTLVMLALCGLFSGIGHIAMTEALARAEPASLSPFDYLVLGWAILADVIILSRAIVDMEWYGLALIVTAALIAGSAKQVR